MTRAHHVFCLEFSHEGAIANAPNANGIIRGSCDHVISIAGEACPSDVAIMCAHNKRERVWPCGCHGRGRDLPKGGSVVFASNDQMGVGRTEGKRINLLK